MVVQMRSSKAYNRLLELMNKYPDEDFSAIAETIITHTMMYMAIKQASPPYENVIESIREYYHPNVQTLEIKNEAVQKVMMLDSVLPVELVSIERIEK